ncbi:MAG: hypothetical protein HC892_23025, partial [Saprospiraceae bacterium]|nr:hypothetical protein [Saprospiraceae bacterium]
MPVTTGFDGGLYWGLSYNETTGMVYATQEDGHVWRMTVAELNDFATPVNPIISRGTGYPNPGDNFLPGGTAFTEGIVSDNAGNMYIVTFTGGLLKYNSSGGFVAGFLEGTVPQIRDTRGIIWSETYNRLFVSNQTDNPTVDCIAAFDPNTLAYLGAAAPNPNLPVDNRAKALAIIKECCPNNLPATFEVNVCGGVGQQFFLNQEAFNSMTCSEGIVCGSSWTPQVGGTGMTFDACDNSVTITGVGCTTFSLNISAIASTGCPAQTSTFTICNTVPPTATAAVTNPTCFGGTAQDNGIITINGFNAGDKYQYSSGTTFDSGNAIPATITAIPAGGVIVSTLPNTTQQYTVRLYSAITNDCFTDVTVSTVASCVGAIGNYVWLDEDSNGLQDEGEAGIPNVQVDLKDMNGNVIATTFTDSDGKYLFPNLPAAMYFVDVVESTLPTGVTQTTVFTNVIDGADADTDTDDGDLGNK